MSKAVADVLLERQRQIVDEGFDHAHDDEHTGGEIAFAAACYAISGAVPEDNRGKDDRLLAVIQFVWPKAWAFTWWSPKDRRRDLVRSAALIVAEIERIDRAST
ncbi:hypothetical protein FY145_07185 [Agrobacterium tumefaciens]|uniref:Uncharacterized protein n=1 Tax=Agrobacterium tumefaciens TaxID=358 RepID=A0AAP9J5S1_AGRTU|nr:hypothetical protein [Agrobacterium tumefaciens]NSZ57813.1 hypothetical protein [Agrobacterium tumefaciens]QDY93932.1 hypothetical protein CG010_007185 [Agrobacterium tumefaciens]UXS49004.1 hypothetical protein FY149_17305 [Agrobacterium tumefaciens]UXS70308.1 hypothetical protein FY146_07185 [Agrobacterium tumefaciens]UXS77970.1 hypothetical protein FY145_07185 [Agrobacterium tumefaciens]